MLRHYCYLLIEKTSFQFKFLYRRIIHIYDPSTVPLKLLFQWLLQPPQDQYADRNGIPIVDESQDVKLMSGYQNDTHTVLRFCRPWTNCDRRDFQLSVSNRFTRTQSIKIFVLLHCLQPSLLALQLASTETFISLLS